MSEEIDMDNKNSETDIGVQAEDQKSKIAKPLESSYFYQIFRLKREWVSVSSHLSSAGITGMYHHCPASMAS